LACYLRRVAYGLFKPTGTGLPYLLGDSWTAFPPERQTVFQRVLPQQMHTGPPVSGFGSPEGIVPAPVGAIYVDLNNSDLYQKQIGTQATGWQKIGTACACPGSGGGSGAPAPQQIFVSQGNPNGVISVTTTLPCLCIDTVNHIIWTKQDGIISNTGWSSP